MKTHRLTFLLILFFFSFCLVIARLFYWQIVKGDALSQEAENQHFVTFEIPASRGKIYARDKTLFVSNEASYLLYADLHLIKDKKNVAQFLTPLLIHEEASQSAVITPDIIKKKNTFILNLLNNKNAVWVTLAHKLSQNTKDKIEKENYNGLGFQNEEKRYYSEDSSLANLLGFVGSDSLGLDKGYFGLEGNYDLQLKGKNGKLRFEKDALGRPIFLAEQEEIKSKQGRDLITTIDKYVQLISDKYLKEGMKTWGAKAGNVIVINPQTGEILAMASRPTYDPAKYTNFSTEIYKNPVIADSFEPGSIFKPFIMSLALEEKKVTSGSRCPSCTGPVVIGEYTIRTFNDQYHPQTTMTEILENSDNTGMVYIGSLLGKEKIYNYLTKLGFGDYTGIDLQEEETGTIKPLSEWYPIDTATVTFGQGIAITPIQMVKAFTAIANKGKMVKPYVVAKEIEEGKEINVAPQEFTQVFKKEVAEVLTEMLINVTLKSPLHFPRDLMPELNKYKIAAKSGTAQIPIAGRYDPNKTVASVIGFAPADNPRFLVYVRLLEPSARIWGSDTAGPIFFNIVKDLLYHFGIPPQ